MEYVMMEPGEQELPGAAGGQAGKEPVSPSAAHPTHASRGLEEDLLDLTENTQRPRWKRQGIDAAMVGLYLLATGVLAGAIAVAWWWLRRGA